MKKWQQTGKKALSVFMAIMMLMTAWVWVAPTEASAATAGNYKVRITWQVNNTKDYSNSFTGTETEDGARAGIILYYKSNNGSGTQSSMYWCLDSTNYGGTYVSAEKSTGNTNSSTGKNYYCVATIAGFPTALYGMADSDNILDKGQYTVSKIEVYNNTKSAYDTLWAGKGYTDTSTEKKWWKITADGDGTVTTTGNDNDYGYASTTTETWNFPTPTTATTWSGVSAMTIPKTGTATQDIELVANDQYGVEMFNPTWSVKGSVCGTTGISVDPTTSSQTTTIKLINAANVSSSTDTQTGTITATWSTLGSLSETFTITDSYYTATFNYKSSAGADTSTKKYGYHGDTITAPSAPEYDSGDYHYVFSKWSPTFASTITKDVTYTAQYTSTFVGADYSAVNEAIAAADAIKANYGTEYELKYTLASRVALDSAINAVVTGLGRTRQSDVDGYADTINAKIAALDPNKFDVIFLDKDGAILLYEKDVEYKEAVTAPTYSATYYDSTNHYTFTGWDTNEYASVVDDLVIQPVFTAEAHTFTTETVPSTCVQKGATKYICSCGYSYIDGETNYGDHVWETEFTTDLEPTCTVAGSKSIHCTLCDAQKDITVIDPLGHQWSSQSVAVEASCGKIGIMTKVCDDCGVCEHTIIPALEHDYAENIVAPTCTTKGYTEYVCQRADCGHSYRDNYTDVIAHTYGAWETVSEALCGVDGVKKQTCTECGYINIGTIDALEHNIGDWVTVVESTCTGRGYKTKTCSLCGNVIEEQWLVSLGHNYVAKTVVAPTCTSKGYTVEECNRADCGAQRNVNEKPALNHAWTSTEHEADCTHSAYIEHVCANDPAHNYIEYVNGSAALMHDFTGDVTIVKSATCEEDGEKTVECSRCDVTTNVIIPKLGHSYSAWEKIDATNDKAGSWSHRCSICGKEETLEIPAGGHNLVEDTAAYVAPTCTTKGKQVYKCTAHENCSISVTVDLDYAQHTVAQGETPATCIKEGSVEAYCSVCGKVFSTEATPVVPHTLNNGTEVAPTCTTSGYTLYECTVTDCDFSYKEYDETKPATGHFYYASETPATCTTEGSTLYICDCGENYTEVIPATGHNYSTVTVVQEQSCTDVEKTEYKCSCGDSYVVITKEAKGHTYDNWEVVTPATADKNGVQKGTCHCGDVEYALIPPIGNHTFTEKVTKEPTCTEKGTKTFTCTVPEHGTCSANYTEDIPATGHTQKLEYTAPTCIADGSSKVVCSVCNAVIMNEPVKATGIHDFSGEGVKVDATCEAPGSITYTCLCGATKVETIPEKGHDLTTEVTDAKCGEQGIVVTTCSACSYTNTTYLAAKGHIWGTTPTATEAATCEANGSETYKCQNCNETNVIVIPALGHNWSAWVKVDATATADGSWSRTCRTCNDTETLVIPKGHNLVRNDDESEAATCTSAGKEVYTCANHADCGVKIEVALEMLQHTVAQRETSATCNNEGSVEAYCSVCKNVLSTEVIPVKAHSFVAQDAVAPTCTESGYTPYKCSDCSFIYNVYDETKPATGHNFDENITANVTVESATCTTDGSKTVKCSACSETNTVVLPKTGHSYTKGTVVNATCTQPGTEVYTCACGDTYTKFVEAVKDHSFGNWTLIQEATTDSYGIEKRVCSVCDATEHKTTAPIGAHDFEKVSETLATCTQTGSIEWKCKTHNDCEANYTETLDKLPHTQEISYTAPSCTANGSSKIVCSVCKSELKSVEIPAKGHAYNDVSVTKDPTCTEAGVRTYTCACGANYTEEIPAKGHDLTTEVTDAKCGEQGTVITTCLACSYTNTTNLAAKGHIWGTTPTATVAATCEANGSETYKCQNCDAENVVVIPALGHDWGEWTVSKASTNTEEGELSRTCSRENCNKTETIKFPAGGHNLVATSKDDATCTAEGSVTYTCDTHKGACGITVTVTLDKLQHKLVKTEEEATCTGDGFVLVKCEDCNTATYETVIPAKGHAYNNVSVKDATCTGDGVRTYTCACGDIRTEAIPAKGHSYKTTVTPATCTAPGSVVTECTVCHSDEAKTVTAIPVMGHDYTGVETLIKSADCETDGSKTVQCSRCDVTTTVILPKFGHSYSDWVKIDATNDKDGSWSRECSTCGKEETLTIPAGGHNLVETENVSSKCNEKGHITYECNAHENCSVTVTVELDYAQHTILKDNADATCTDNGHSITYCKECGVKFNNFEIPAKGHIYEGQVTLPATCTGEGVMTYTCSKCNDSYTVSVPMTQHTYEPGEEVKATCTTRGYIPYSCTTSGCTSGYEFLTEEAKGHTYKQTVSSSTCTKGGKVTLECECGDTIEADVPALGHAYALSATTAADCTAAATETYTCSLCDASYTVSTGEKTAHDFGEYKVIAEATEDALGYKTRSCKVCGFIELEEIAAIGDHVFTIFKRETPATCTDPGETVYGCSTHDDCGLTSTVVIPANGHVMEETAAAVVPTCDSDGTTAVFTCKNGCGKVEGGEKIAALGHIYGEGEVTPATCKDEGKIVYTCGRCGGTHTAVIETNENAHQYETTVTDATCTKEGTVIAKCKLCGNETLNKPLPKLEHTWSVDKTTPATCDTDGTTYYKCSCGATKETAIPKLGHRMTAGLSVDATCTENGYTPYTCTNSGCTYTYNVYNAPAIAHNYVQVENSSTADCVNGGTVTLRCSECDKEITAAVPALGHDWGEWTTTKNPTAADEGEVERSCKRDGCNATETVPLPALGHEMVKDEVNSTAATCTAEGRDVYVCKTHTDCGYTYYVKTSKLAHDYDEGTVTEKATCTTDGEKTYTCKCGATVTELIPKTAHTLSTAVTEATCQVQGSVVTSCADCEYEIKTDLGYGVHKLTVVRESEPDCETKGIITVKCSETGCTHIADTIELPATGHDWSGEESDIVPATCETDGSKKVKCLHCEETTTVVIPATGHNYAEGESFAATCITSGYTVFACDCGSSYSRLDSQPNGHSWDEGTVKTPADCVNEGIILVKCENCEASYEKTVSKLCHSWGAWVTTKYPTASEEGEMTRICSRNPNHIETSAIPSLGDSTYTVTFIVDGKEYAKQTIGYGGAATDPGIPVKPYDESKHYNAYWDVDFSAITSDLTVTAVYNETAHTFGEWTTVRESTCQSKGYQTRACACGYEETRDLELSDHDYTIITEDRMEATCTENGYVVVICSACGKSTKQTVKRLGHSMTYHERVYETCDTDGSLAYYECSVCGKKYADRIGNTELINVVVRKKYHTFVVVEGSAATCTSDGKTDYRHCTTCGLNQPSETIPALGHVDVNNDHICDRCSGTYMEGGQIVCTCNCHKVGFFNELIYKILRFFWKLMGSNKTCACGAIHY